MKEIIDHIKKVAIQDFREFFAPFVFVFRFIRSVTSATFRGIRSRWNRYKKGDK